jgi:nitrous oxidase accessory protein
VDRAAPGDTVVVRGVHRERVKIVGKRLELAGEPAAVLDGTGEGSVVAIADAPGTVVRDLAVNGTGTSHVLEDSGVLVDRSDGVRVERVRVTDALFGIHVRSSAGAAILSCTVRGKLDIPVAKRGDGIKVFSSARSRIEGCLVEDTRDVIVWFSEGSHFAGNLVRRARYGLHLMNTADALCEENRIEEGSVGIFSMYSRAVRLRHNRIGPVRGPSGYAIGLKDTDAFAIEENVLGDARVGIFFDGSPLRPDEPGLVRANHVVACDAALSFMPAVKGVTLCENAFVENGAQVEVRGGGKLVGNEWARDGRGNHWSDYEGFDVDGDGVGDTPYRAMNLYESLVDAHPELALFEGSPAARAIDWGARVAPLFAPDAKVEDPRPLVDAPPLPRVPGGPAPSGSSRLVALGLALAVAGAGALARAGRIT